MFTLSHYDSKIEIFNSFNKLKMLLYKISKNLFLIQL